ncbi:hypothetical protein RJT34_24557 [Clitoria ternatea]|uniref:Myb-like domain-containing protein n=1 Tax=Clitoria ternatea TaxID=43366 RepID=A0AAN9II41_CLITE
MEEDHHHHHHLQHHHPQQDLRQLLNGPAGPAQNNFPSMSAQPTPPELFPGHHRNLTQQHYEVMMFGRDIMPRGLHDFGSNDSASVTVPLTTTSPPPPLFVVEAEGAPSIPGDASTGRWPRQETLTLLEIRSRLDPKFKEANQKGPLWDELSRIMSEEHGYQRSGKKCREKFENLYKYYKKTKEGKAGRHDGKHYRFFRQLEALYGENSNPVSVPETKAVSNDIHFQTGNYHPRIKHCDSLSLTNSTDFCTSSSSDDGDNHHHHHHHHSMENIESMEKRKKRKSRRGWKGKIIDFIDSQMRKLVEKQKEWLDKLVRTLEEKEKERMVREEEWRKQESRRLEREQQFWAKERAWIEARDSALMEALQRLTGREIIMKGTDQNRDDEGVNNIMELEIQNHSGGTTANLQNNEDGSDHNNWPESEITRLQQLRAEMETRFPQSECLEEVKYWEEVATKMAYFGYERSAFMCKEKWESINFPKEGNNKKRKENLRSSSCFYFKNIDDQPSLFNQGRGAYCDDINDQRLQQSNDGSSPSNSNVAPGDACFPFLMSTDQGGNLWENYALNKANQNH